MNKSIVLQILKYLPLKPLFRPFYSGCGSILFMHKVISHHEDRQRIEMMKANEIDVDFLEKMLLYLKKKYDIISIDEMTQVLKLKKKLKKKFIVITFDDGYKDNITLAYPIFKKLQIPLTIYITNCFPNKTANLWWYMLEDILLEKSKIRLTYKNKHHQFICENQNQKNKSFEKIRGIIINANAQEQKLILDQLQDNYNKDLTSYINKEALSWEEIEKISKDPLVTIGCHTKNHLSLNTLSKKEQIKEILDSKIEIDKRTNKDTNHFAYPFGTSNEINKNEVENLKSTLSFTSGTTTRTGNIFEEHANHMYALPRIQVLGTQADLSVLELYICGLIPALKNKFRKTVTL
ncbi:polysaccharide deacetylase family protein [Psychroflexus montanilacus]|uniref:polysaccharide deacetylase family protein n=1 Tax=Psychroflexus montanilacus TaxID=2873598 RepID=UPI001CC91D33|nr:polysaccharide deacetylase family protein [Psychroflexus montanilacus]MBZ9652272.1 polysaccharide deacetylase family protein [Psychroflexus montanilacus]